MNTKGKGKAIIGIAMTAIMLASVFAAMVPTVSAASQGDNFNRFNNQSTPVQKVLIGQNLYFNGFSDTPNVTVYRYVAGDLENTYATDSTGKIYGVNWPTSGAYYASDDPTSETSRQSQAQLSVGDPSVPLKLKVGTKEVSTLTLGTNLTIDTGGINLFDQDKVDLEIIGPGNLKITTKNDQNFSNITVADLRAFGTSGSYINTTEWRIGDYTFQVKTKSANACGLDASSNVKKLTIIKGEIDISAETTTVTELKEIKLTVTGVSGDEININATPGSPHVLFQGGVEDTPRGVTGDNFTDTIDADGKRTYAVKFDDTGAYTIRAEVTSVERKATYDVVDISVTEKDVTFDVPYIVVIGERLTIKGTSNTGTRVTIAVEDTICDVLKRLVIDADNEFSKEIDTTDACGNLFSVPGSVRLKAFIDPETDPNHGDPVPTEWSADGSVVLLMTRGDLTAELSTTNVAQEDEFTISGTAKGSRSVDIVIVSPKGSGGSTIEPGAERLGKSTIYSGSTSVSEIDYTFSKKVTVGANVDTGNYLVVVLSKGSDDRYGTKATSLDDAMIEYSLGAKIPEQILEIIEDASFGAAGSDDLVWMGYVKVASATVTLNPIASIAVGEPLVVTGATNRKEGYAIVVTVKGPMELTPKTVNVENGTFSATFDTTDAKVGTYEVMADDGDGHMDDVTVEIVKEIVPVATPTPTAKPPVAPVPTAEPTPELTPTPTPTEEPGFEAVFAIAGLLSIAYLVLRRRK